MLTKLGRRLLRDACEAIDAQFGTDYSKKNPQLVGAVLSSYVKLWEYDEMLGDAYLAEAASDDTQ